jgi:hypothetical protein
MIIVPKECWTCKRGYLCSSCEHGYNVDVKIEKPRQTTIAEPKESSLKELEDIL